MPLTAICGHDFNYNMGNLKSYFMTLNAYMNYKNGSKIFSNYTLNFPYEQIYSLSELSKDLDSLNNATVLIDEIPVYFDQYMKPSKKNGTSAFKNFARQTRKRSVKMYCTAQSFNDINLSLRKVIGTIWLTRKLHPDYSLCENDKCHKPHIIEIETVRAMYNGLRPLREPTYFPVSPEVFKLYNTDEIIEIVD